MQAIKERVMPQPTQLAQSLHNQLIEILSSATKSAFYQLIENFYQLIKDH